MPELFEHRLRVGKETGEGRVIKLALNSLYGKLAQRLHGKYSSRIWAGMITAGTRAQVLDLISKHEKQSSVIMVATDGVFSTEYMDVPKRVTLGGWERTDYPAIYVAAPAPHSVILARPGIYWTPGGKLKARGMGRDTLDRAQVQLAEAIDAGAERVRLPSRTVFGGAKLTVYRTRAGAVLRSKEYGQWHEIPTNVSLSPAPKRAVDFSPPSPQERLESRPFGEPRGAKQDALLQILEELQALSE